MSRSSLGVIPLTGKPQVLSLPNQLTDCLLRLGNDSDYTLQWSWGTQSGLLYPAEVRILAPDATAPPVLELLPVTNLTSNLTLTHNLLAELAFAPDNFGNDSPQQMSRLTQQAASVITLFVNPAIANDTGLYTVNDNFAHSFNFKVLQPGVQSIRFRASAALSTKVNTFFILGDITGHQYMPVHASPNLLENVAGTATLQLDNTFRIDPLDTSFTVDMGLNNGSIQFSLSANLGFADQAVEVMDTQPSFWQVPTKAISIGLGTIAAGGNFLFISASSQLAPVLFDFDLHIIGNAGSFGVLELDDGTLIRNINFGVSDTVHINFDGFQLPIGRGLRLRNSSAVGTGALNGGLLYG